MNMKDFISRGLFRRGVLLFTNLVEQSSKKNIYWIMKSPRIYTGIRLLQRFTVGIFSLALLWPVSPSNRHQCPANHQTSYQPLSNHILATDPCP